MYFSISTSQTSLVSKSVEISSNAASDLVSVPLTWGSPFLTALPVMLTLPWKSKALDSQTFFLPHGPSLLLSLGPVAWADSVFIVPTLPLVSSDRMYPNVTFLSNHFQFTQGIITYIYSHMGRDLNIEGTELICWFSSSAQTARHVSDLQLKCKSSQRDGLRFTLLDRCLWEALVRPRGISMDPESILVHSESGWSTGEVMKRQWGRASLPLPS